MAAASLFPCRAIASDIDPLATATARQNVAANHVADRVAASRRRASTTV
jgi:ribosomal protein L11 methyltransferase